MTQGYSVRGGHEAHLLHFATEMRRHGFDTRVRVLDALPRTEHRFMQLLRERGIPLDGVRCPRGLRVSLLFWLLAPAWWLILRWRGQQPSMTRLRDYLANRIAARDLRRRLRREQPALIHIMGRLADYAWPLLPADRVILHHGTEGRRDESWDDPELAAFRAFAQAAARNVAPGTGVAENLRREFGITREIVSIFSICPDQGLESSRVPPPLRGGGPHALASEPPGRSPDGTSPSLLRFGILCRMTPEKGIRTLLEALRLYHARHGALDFTFAGSGTLEGEIRGFIARYQLPGVRIQADFNAPADVLRQWDVFVHPSLSDAMPMAIAEALMCGLPCIATRVGGIPDLIRDGVEGLLIAPGDPQAIAAAMARFQAMPASERTAFGARARARYEEVCRPDRVGLVLEKHYRSVLAKEATALVA
ncbi:MAG: glycosyltransferase family 4 protein [Verrucomicrobia bacterium]|nr:glycosyltransferase family 4 protein [Verrucomicrobiota bacterium]